MRLPALVLGLLGLAACDETAMVYPIGAPTAAAPVSAATAAAPDAGMEASLNAYRRQAGLPAATADARLIRAAQAHADDMAASGYINHLSRDGRNHVQRAMAQGYPQCPMAENIGYGQASSAGTFAEWTASPGHASNMVMPGPMHYGFGRTGEYYVLLMAQPC